LMQVLVSLERDDADVAEYAGYRSYDFRLNGEVVKDGALFESFRYKYGFPAEQTPQTVPLSFQRLLRPGEYHLIVRVDDLNSGKIYRVERSVTVPRIDTMIEMPTFRDPETESLFAEATAALAGETGLRLIPPQGELLTGFTRFDAVVAGDEIAKVRFVLDDKPLLTKNRPPFQVSIDLGPYPDVHELRAEGLDTSGRVVADDELLLNTSGYRFVAKLREPRPGQRYERSLQARLEVDLPEGRSLERVELYLNETLVATLYQEPFVHPIVLPTDGAVGYVRAVAYLPDGNSTEDLVFINSPGEVEEVDVQFVELYTSVLDSQGRPVADLTPEQITVLEDEVPQEIRRFERVEDLPIHVGIVLDTSASMVGVLPDVRRAALSFLDQAVTPKDRAAVVTFNTFPELKVPLTNDAAALGAGLAGLAPEGRTALYDSVMFSLYYFAGVKGQRALLILSDGKDESSRFDFDQTLEYARRAGITLYTIGLRLGDPSARSKLRRLAEETGGMSFTLRGIEELEPVYAQIQQELRSQLLIAYQSSNISDDEVFRRVLVEVDRPGVTVRTLAGYYP
ncbi:MAG: VWA domain-containing protein, partial [Acidobacteriota bacterium]